MYTSNALLKNDKWTIAPRVTCDNISTEPESSVRDDNFAYSPEAGSVLIILQSGERYHALFYKAESATNYHALFYKAESATMTYFTKRRALPCLIFVFCSTSMIFYFYCYYIFDLFFHCWESYKKTKQRSECTFLQSKNEADTCIFYETEFLISVICNFIIEVKHLQKSFYQIEKCSSS